MIDLEYLNIKKYKEIYRNLSVSNLVEMALERKEGKLTETGALSVKTGKYTGRSPKDRFIVRDKNTENKINWGDVCIPTTESVFDNLYNKVVKYLEDKELFIFDGKAGASDEYSMPIRVICEYAYQALYSRQIFRRLTDDELKMHNPEFNIIAVPEFKANAEADGVHSEAFILINFTKKIVLIGGTKYSGEIKKSVFSIMNYLLPQKSVLPMHCSANEGQDEGTVVFFGLSGTGKTTLSTDPDRKLIGDDEHGWSDEGIFNFEGGCYAKTINLDKEKEKEIYNAIKFGSVIENVIIDENGKPDYTDGSLTENTRTVYPINYIENIKENGKGKSPSKIIFLTADAFGVMPPVSRLTKEAAMYHFMSGYTSKVAGTERGITEPTATFSACFGEPFMLMNPAVYAQLLGEKIEKYDTEVYLVNTGWIGGGYGVGKRINLPYTRAMVHAIISGKLKNVEYYDHSIFNLRIPKTCPNVPDEILDPRNLWKDKDAYDSKAMELADKFEENFKKFKEVSDEISEAGIKELCV